METEYARFYNWTPREFYFGLRITLVGKALETIRSMEDDMELTSFAALIPTWFEPTGEEWREVYDGTATFSTLSHRMQVAVVITHFHKQFQVQTGDQAYNMFRFSSQRSDETIKEWGKRLDRSVTKLQRFSMNINFGQFLRKWRTGTRHVGFCKELQDTILPKDPKQAPIITGYDSFVAWRDRCNQRALDTKKQTHEKATLMSMQRRVMAPRTSSQWGTPKGKVDPAQLKRTGPFVPPHGVTCCLQT